MPLASYQVYDESALLAALQSGNPKAFDELYARFSPTLLKVILRIVPDQDQAQDLLQDSFVKIWGNRHRYDPAKARLFSWMITIVRNTAFSHLRATRYEGCPVDQISAERLGVTITPYQVIGLAGWVASTLSGNDLRIINLVYFQDYTFQEVSDELGLPLGSVKTCVRRALQRLRKNT